MNLNSTRLNFSLETIADILIGSGGNGRASIESICSLLCQSDEEAEQLDDLLRVLSQSGVFAHHNSTAFSLQSAKPALLENPFPFIVTSNSPSKLALSSHAAGAQSQLDPAATPSPARRRRTAGGSQSVGASGTRHTTSYARPPKHVRASVARYERAAAVADKVATGSNDLAGELNQLEQLLDARLSREMNSPGMQRALQQHPVSLVALASELAACGGSSCPRSVLVADGGARAHEGAGGAGGGINPIGGATGMPRGSDDTCVTIKSGEGASTGGIWLCHSARGRGAYVATGARGGTSQSSQLPAALQLCARLDLGPHSSHREEPSHAGRKRPRRRTSRDEHGGVDGESALHGGAAGDGLAGKSHEGSILNAALDAWARASISGNKSGHGAGYSSARRGMSCRLGMRQSDRVTSEAVSHAEAARLALAAGAGAVACVGDPRHGVTSDAGQKAAASSAGRSASVACDVVALVGSGAAVTSAKPRELLQLAASARGRERRMRSGARKYASGGAVAAAPCAAAVDRALGALHWSDMLVPWGATAGGMDSEASLRTKEVSLESKEGGEYEAGQAGMGDDDEALGQDAAGAGAGAGDVVDVVDVVGAGGSGMAGSSRGIGRGRGRSGSVGRDRPSPPSPTPSELEYFHRRVDGLRARDPPVDSTMRDAYNAFEDEDDNVGAHHAHGGTDQGGDDASSDVSGTKARNQTDAVPADGSPLLRNRGWAHSSHSASESSSGSDDSGAGLRSQQDEQKYAAGALHGSASSGTRDPDSSDGLVRATIAPTTSAGHDGRVINLLTGRRPPGMIGSSSSSTAAGHRSAVHPGDGLHTGYESPAGTAVSPLWGRGPGSPRGGAKGGHESDSDSVRRNRRRAGSPYDASFGSPYAGVPAEIDGVTMGSPAAGMSPGMAGRGVTSAPRGGVGWPARQGRLSGAGDAGDGGVTSEGGMLLGLSLGDPQLPRGLSPPPLGGEGSDSESKSPAAKRGARRATGQEHRGNEAGGTEHSSHPNPPVAAPASSDLVVIETATPGGSSSSSLLDLSGRRHGGNPALAKRAAARRLAMAAKAGARVRGLGVTSGGVTSAGMGQLGSLSVLGRAGGRAPQPGLAAGTGAGKAPSRGSGGSRASAQYYMASHGSAVAGSGGVEPRKSRRKLHRRSSRGSGSN